MLRREAPVMWLFTGDSVTQGGGHTHGCHPNEYGHRVLAHAIFRAVGLWDPASRVCQYFVPR